MHAFLAPISSVCAGKTDVLNGAFAGLAAITAGSGFVPPWSAIIIGAVGGFVSFYTVTLFKEREYPSRKKMTARVGRSERERERGRERNSLSLPQI